VTTQRGRLLRKYVFVIVGLVAGALVASGLVEIYFSYEENRNALVALQREKALGAASRIEGFMRDIERQIGWTTQLSLVAPAEALEQRRLDYVRLFRQVPAITELSYLDATGKEQLRLSRVAIDVVGSQVDYSGDPRFTVPRSGRAYYGEVYFRKGSEPYMTLALPISGGGVTVADVNLKFIWDVVSRIKVGPAARAFVVDGQGALIAHPDISLVLQKTSLAGLDHVRAALAEPADGPAPADQLSIGRDPQGRRVMTAHSTIGLLGWIVFVEQPLEEALQPLSASITRTALLVLVGVAFAVGASLLLARRMVRPIRALQEGAARIGAGELGHRIEVRTGDEVEALAAQFNRMTADLQESYATLEQRVLERTRELSEALARQTATGDILRAISSSPTDLRPVFDTIAENAVALCDAAFGAVLRRAGDRLELVAAAGQVPADLARGATVAIDRDAPSGRALLERAVIHIPDLRAAAEYRREVPRTPQGPGTMLAVPMLREDAALGTITLYRREVRPFAAGHVELVRTFADQAVIAIENARLFTELRARTAELSRSVQELTALGEVSQALSSTLRLETVLETIAARTNQLAGADGCAIFEYDEHREEFRLRRASQEFAPAFARALRDRPIPRAEGLIGRAAALGEPLQVADIAPDDAESPVRTLVAASGYRALLAVPFLRDGHVLGGLVVNRKVPGEFPPEVVNALKTFASQCALAIQNARLFEEIEAKTRELEVATRHKSEFLANMSHELRTPLNAVIGFSEVLLERMFGDVNDKQEEYLNDILGSGRHLLSLINDILDLSKIEAGRMELNVASFDLPQAIEQALTLVRERAARRTIALGVGIDAGLGAVKGDERKIKQVLLNLLSNAIKFTPEGGRVEVLAKPVAGRVEISVSDTGIGIAPEDQEAVFDEFRQVGTDSATKREGTGLGLTLARRFVELHGGRLWVKSAPGQGSTFTLSLPRRS
jgi:signal transduction histidine kinase